LLPFEDRFSRQRRLPEVGADGQRRLGSRVLSLAPHADVDVERDYLERSGVAGTRIDGQATELPFPFAEHFEFQAPLSVARGAWYALHRIRHALGIRPGS
jgi:hypothetical protein